MLHKRISSLLIKSFMLKLKMHMMTHQLKSTNQGQGTSCSLNLQTAQSLIERKLIHSWQYQQRAKTTKVNIFKWEPMDSDLIVV